MPAKDMPKEMIPTPPAKTPAKAMFSNARDDCCLRRRLPMSVWMAWRLLPLYEFRTVAAPTQVMGRLFSR